MPNPSVSDAPVVLPDSTCTPGVANPDVTQANIGTTICDHRPDRPGNQTWAQSVRPPVSVTSSLKAKQMRDYGASMPISQYEEDHLISLELGGAPADPKNLWPEPGPSVNNKDKVENQLNSLVCSGALTLSEAQHRIQSNWTTAIP